MKNKLSKNIIIDVILLVVLMFLSWSSFVMEFYLPCGHGTCGHGHGAGLGLRHFWDLNRHGWGDIHMYIGLVFIALLFIHIVMHWGMLDGFFKKHIASPTLRYLIYFLLILGLLATMCPWIYYLI